MKPSDHPEFFRLPAPEGRSRESGIVLDAQGHFWHRGERVEHPGMARAFASWIHRHPDDGRYILNNGYDWSYFQVEEVPFFVNGVENRQGVPWIQLSDESTEMLDVDTLRIGPRDAVYLDVKGRAFPARFMPEAQTALSDWLVPTRDGSPGVVVHGHETRIPVSSEIFAPSTK